ncbi:MAG TPA: hypothetical protein DEF47_17205 [Herpetosiphon sp.]|nr:hypothetical protein [Herpetosiphon sp.]
MNQKQLNTINLIAGVAALSARMMQIYQVIVNATPWNYIFCAIGLCLMGLSLLLQKKIHIIANITLIISSLICFVISIIMFLI